MLKFQTNDYYPWETANSNKEEIKNAYADTLLITPNGYNRNFVKNFQKKFSQETGIIDNFVSDFLDTNVFL